MNIKSWSGQISSSPLFYLFGCGRIPGNVIFCVFDLFIFKPDPGPAAARTPFVAEQDNAFQLKFFFNFLCPCGFNGLLIRLDPPDLIEKGLIIRLIVNIMDIHILNDAILINDEYRPFRSSFMLPERAIFFSDLSVGPEITDQGVRNTTQAFSPSF